jgi:uncharacterized membrane protein
MQRRKNHVKNLIIVIFLLFLIWTILQFVSPFALPRGSVTTLSGAVGVSDNEYTIQNMSFPWNIPYSIGDRLCHQRADRSLFLNENEMPFCTRCTAIWVGLTLGLGVMVLFIIELNMTFIFTILLSLVPIGIDGVGQLVGFWESTNGIRFFTGLLAGGICGIALGIIIDETKELVKDMKRKKEK